MKHQGNDRADIQSGDSPGESDATRDSAAGSVPGDSPSELGDGEPEATDDPDGNKPARSDPSSGYYNIVLASGKIVSKHYAYGRPVPGEGECVKVLRGGPYKDFDVALARSRADLFYPHLLRKCLERGIFTAAEGRRNPTQAEVAEWCDYSPHVVECWLRPVTSKSRRKMSRRAIRLVIHEFKLHDSSNYNWDGLLRYCR